MPRKRTPLAWLSWGSNSRGNCLWTMFKMMTSNKFTCIITFLCILTLVYWAFQGGEWTKTSNRVIVMDNLEFQSGSGKFRRGHSDKPALTGVMFENGDQNWNIKSCGGLSDSFICLEWLNIAKLTIEREADDSMTCHSITWYVLAEHVIPRDCFDIGDAHWYGGAEVSNQRWPMERGSQYHSFPFLPGGDLVGPYHEDLLERYWISSKGIAIKADDTIPLFVDWDVNGDGKFCLTSMFSKPYQHSVGQVPKLRYHVCQGSNLKTVQTAAAQKFFHRPSDLVDTKMIIAPVWSTWAKYHDKINQSGVLQMAQEIVSNGYSHSQIEIDDMFTSSYGATDFDKGKFPDATGMVKTLKSMGLRVTAWFHPFINVDSPVFTEGMKAGYFVQDLSGKVPALTEWWNGVAALLDVTNPDARMWFSDRLKKFKDIYKIDSFKFDAGSAVQFPANFTTHSPINNTAFFTTKYIEMCAEFGPMVEVRAGFCNQNLPVFFRFQDMDSKWDFDNGLKSLIPRALLFGLIGYPFLLPDMIGGNAYNGFPEKELYIRWMQVSAFMPSWQFSITPGQYDDETVRIAKDMMTVRETFLKPYLLQYAEEAVAFGNPIVRPLWWICPDDVTCQITETEFLIGVDVLVAPVLDKGVVSRDVYIPTGRWRDKKNLSSFSGPKWLRDYPVSLDTIPYFVRLHD